MSEQQNNGLIILLIFIGMISILYTAYHFWSKDQLQAEQAYHEVLHIYLQQIANQEYPQAYLQTSNNYQQSTSFAEFSKAQQNHYSQYGPLNKWDRTMNDVIHEPGSSYARIRLQLHYEKQTVNVSFDVSLQDTKKIIASYFHYANTLRKEIY